MSMIEIVENRGTIKHERKSIGITELESKINVYCPNAQREIDTVFIGGMHGDEPETVVLLSAALRSVKVSFLKVYVIPCANPDGISLGHRANFRGVDLNRNFPTQCWRSSMTYYSWSSIEKDKVSLSTGVEAGSERETRCILDFILKEKIKTVVSVHSPLNFVEAKNESYIGNELSNRLGLPFLPEGGHEPGSLASWCNENGIDIITLELPSISVDETIYRYSEALVPFLSSAL